MLDKVLLAESHRLEFDVKAGGLQLAGNPVGGRLVAHRAEPVGTERGVMRDVVIEPRAREEIFRGGRLTRHHRGRHRHG
jgi:hypothetical protein